LLPANLERSFFDPHLHTVFAVELSPGQTFDVELTEIRSLPPHPAAQRTPFALTFRAKDKSVPPQRTYRLTHPILGEAEIFLVPIGPDEVAMRYEAVFN